MAKRKNKIVPQDPDYVVCETIQSLTGGSYQRYRTMTERELMTELSANGYHYDYIFSIKDNVPVDINISLGGIK